MEKFYFEKPSIERKNDAIEYIKEHQYYNSNTAGTSGLNKAYEDYEQWLNTLEIMSKPETCPSDKCCGIQYFLIRESDNKLIGMLNLRWGLNDFMLNYGGHIGYGIRPTERNKGYNKINLYLGLLEAQKLGIDKALIIANDDNMGSYKTIESLGGTLENKIKSYKDTPVPLRRYWIDVNDSIDKYRNIYEGLIVQSAVKK